MTTITTGTSGPQAWKIALVAGAVGLATLVAVNLPQTTSDETGQPVAQTATATLPESVTGFEYNNESTSGQAASPGVVSQYTGNSGELFPYENGQAPQTVPSQEIDSLVPAIRDGSLDVAVSPSINENRQAPGTVPSQEIDSLVGGTTRVAPTPDSIADAQVRAEAAELAAPAPSFAASDEALVNPVPEVDAGQLIQDLIAAELVAPAYALAALDEALVNPASSIPANANAEAGTNARWGALHGAYHNGTLSSYTNSSDVSPQWQAYIDAAGNGSAGAYFQSSATEPLIDERVNGVDSADIKFLGTSAQSEGTQRIPQQNVSMR